MPHIRARQRRCLLAVSHTGTTCETVTARKGARETGAKTLVVTSFPRFSITDFANVVPAAGGPEQSFRMEATTSRIAHLRVLAALFVATAVRIKRRADPALDTTYVLGGHRY